MTERNAKYIPTLCIFLYLTSCQNMQTANNHTEKGSLSSDDGQLDLSQSTLEEQKIQRANAKKSLLAAREKRTVIEPEKTEELDQKSAINIALYARQTSNAVGEKIYIRILSKKKKIDPCFRFMSADNAQRFFLEKDGPEKDFWNLDPDGDGFACAWNPMHYRNLLVD